VILDLPTVLLLVMCPIAFGVMYISLLKDSM
jgi:hypothetical protein